MSKIRADDRPATPERIAKSMGEFEARFIEQENSPRVEVMQMLDGHILDKLAARRQITGDQLAAGQRYFQDAYDAGVLSSGVIDPERVVVDGGNSEPAQIRQIEAAERLAATRKAIGVVHTHVMDQVVCNEVSLLEYGRKYFGKKDKKDATQDATRTVCNALRDLDFYYYGRRKNRSHYAHAEDYKPESPADVKHRREVEQRLRR